MTDAAGYGKRIRRALRVWASQFETATYEEFGQRVAEIEKRDPAKGPYTSSAVSEWIQDRSEPKIATFKAIQKLTGFRASWLMLGELPERVDEAAAPKRERTETVDEGITTSRRQRPSKEA